MIRKNYPLIICAVSFLLYFCACGLVTISFSTYLPYLKADIGLTNTETSLINTVRCLVSVVAMALAGKYYKKFSLRLGTTMACVLLAIAYLLFSKTDSALMCYINAAIMGAAYAWGTMIPAAIIINNWFRDRGAIALAVVACGSSVSTAVMPPVITGMIGIFGMRDSFLVEAVFIAIVAAILFAVLRDKPSDIGLEPYRCRETKNGAKIQSPAMDTNLSGPELALFFSVMFLVGWAGTPYTNHLSIHYVTEGFSASQVALALSLFGFTMIAGKFLFGVASNRFGTYRINYLFLGAWIISCFFTAALNADSMVLLYASSILNGIGIPIGTIGITLWCRDISSPEEYGCRVQRAQTLFSLGALVGAPLPGMIADITGSYAPAYAVFGVTVVYVLVTVQIIYRRHIFAACSGQKTAE